MSYKKTNILTWNVRGLGLKEKCNVVRQTLRTSRCDICMLQETKLNEITLDYLLSLLPSYFDPHCIYNLANNSKGGILIAWKKKFKLISSWSTMHTSSVLLLDQTTGSKACYTVVYGPSVDVEKPNFLHELKSLSNLVQNPWILAGDFNLVRWMIDRSGDFRSIPLMDLFNQFIQDAALIDIPLKNRQYTWSNKRPQPTFSKIDRVFVSTHWNITYPLITLEALEMMVSDHAPLLLTCKNNAPQQKKI